MAGVSGPNSTYPWLPALWALVGLEHPYCHQMTTQTHPRGDSRVSEKVKNLKMLSWLSTAMSSNFRALGFLGKGGDSGGHRCYPHLSKIGPPMDPHR